MENPLMDMFHFTIQAVLYAAIFGLFLAVFAFGQEDVYENSVVNVIQGTGYVDKTYKTETDLSKGLPLLVFSMEDGNGGHRVDYGKKLNYIVHMKVKTPWGYMERSKHSSTVSLVAQ